MSSDLSSLNLLLQATARSTVEKCLTVAFVARTEGLHSQNSGLSALTSLLSLEEGSGDAEKLLTALNECISVCISSGDMTSLAELFEERGQEVNPKLKSLVGQIITAKLPAWREAAVS